MCIRDRPCSPPSFRSLSKTKTTAEHGMSHQTRWSGTHNNVTRAPCCVTRLMRKGKVGECLMANDTRDRTRELQDLLLFSWAVRECRAKAAAGEHGHGDEGFGCVESVGAFGQCS